MRAPAWRLSIALAALLLAACAGLPPAGPRVPEAAIAASASTPLGAAAGRAAAAAGAAAATESTARSGFLALPQAGYALDARVELMRRAQSSLDIQYYLIGKDATGLLLLRELRQAARRGVRVRLLVDDVYTVGMDPLLAALAAEPGLQVRLFNPFAFGRDSAALRAIGLLADFGRFNHRMHNKLLLADGAFAVIGGRNMADEYFLRRAGANFVDFDALATGPVVADLAHIFDGYCNSEHVLPIGRIAAGATCCAGPPGAGADRFEQEQRPAAGKPRRRARGRRAAALEAAAAVAVRRRGLAVTVAADGQGSGLRPIRASTRRHTRQVHVDAPVDDPVHACNRAAGRPGILRSDVAAASQHHEAVVAVHRTNAA